MKIKLQEILNSKNKTIYSLSKEINVSPNNLGKLIKGDTTSIKYDILEKLCITLNVTPNDIFEIENPLYNIEPKGIETNTILGSDAMKVAEESSKYLGYDPIPTDDAYYEMGKMQDRFDMERKLSNNLFKIIDYIIYNVNTSDFPELYIDDINKYKSMTDSTDQSRFIFIYRILCIIIVSQFYNVKLIDFISNIKDIYSNSAFLDINDDILNNLLDTSENLLATMKSTNKKD